MIGGWRVTEHVCRKCLGRVLEADGVFQCVMCETKGRTLHSVCGCGLSFGKGKAAVTGFRCAPNPAPTPANPARFVILFGDEPAPPVPASP